MIFKGSLKKSLEDYSYADTVRNFPVFLILETLPRLSHGRYVQPLLLFLHYLCSPDQNVLCKCGGLDRSSLFLGEAY